MLKSVPKNQSSAVERRLSEKILLWILLAAAGFAAAAEAGTRTVSLTGASLQAFQGTPIRSVSLFRFDLEAGSWHRIPFQIDETDGTEIWGNKNGILDPQDMFAFFLKDLGDSAKASSWAGENPDGEQRIQIAVTDSLSGIQGYAYLYRMQDAGSDTLLRYDFTTDRISSPVYVIGHGTSGLQEELCIKASAGGDSLDLFDRQKLRLHLRVTEGGLDKTVVIREEMDEDVEIFSGFSIHVRVYKKRVEVGGSGAVRLWRRLQLGIEASGSLFNQTLRFRDTLQFVGWYYPDHAEWGTPGAMIPDPSEGDITQLRMSLDLSKNAESMVFRNPFNPEGDVIDRLPKTLNDSLVWPGVNWYLVSADPSSPEGKAKNGSLVNVIEFRGDPLGNERSLYYRDFFFAESHDTGDRLSIGDTGFMTKGKISGELRLAAATYVLPENLSLEEASGVVENHLASPDAAASVQDYIPVRRILLQTQPEGMRIQVDGEYSDPGTWIWEQGSRHTLCADSLEFVDAGTRYRFLGWEGSGSLCMEYGVGMDDTLTAVFLAQHFLNTAVDPLGAGSVEPSPPGIWADWGSRIGIRAEAAGWYSFLGWYGDAAGEENPDSLTLDRPKSVTARFGNSTPQVQLGDTVIAEDDTLILSWDWILENTEDNNPDSSLSILSLSGNHMVSRVDTLLGLVFCWSLEPHWFGLDSVAIGVMDPLGAAGWDTIRIRVLPESDAPLPFSLLEPLDGTAFQTLPPEIFFSWEQAVDPDPGDSLLYVWEMDTTLNFSNPLIRIEGLKQTSLTLPVSLLDAEYFWRVHAKDRDGLSTVSEEAWSITVATAVQQDGEGQPEQFVLQQNYPNPFNQSTLIRYGLPQAAEVNLVVYNMFGQWVKVLDLGMKEAGYFTAIWDGTNMQGQPVSTGVYFVLMQSGSFRSIRRVILIR